MFKLKNTYKKRYTIRKVGEKGLNTIVSIPRPVIEREASKRSLSIDEFMVKYDVVAHYNNFDGIFYTFEERKS